MPRFAIPYSLITDIVRLKKAFDAVVYRVLDYGSDSLSPS
jgi:hypothetical protein